MSITRLPNGRLRAQVYDPVSGRNVSVAKVLGLPRHQSTWPDTRQGRRDAIRAREDARLKLGTLGEVVTVAAWRERWLTDPLFARPKASTMVANDYATRPFAKEYGRLPLAAVNARTVSAYLAGGNRNYTVPALRAMFTDAMSKKGGELVDRNPFAGLGIGKRTRRYDDPPSEATVRLLIEHAERQGGPGFAAWITVACYVGMRPGELDALRWENIDLEHGVIHVREQWSAHSRRFTLPKNGQTREAPLTQPARAALLQLPPQEAAFCFVTLRRSHFTPSSRAYAWKATRAAAGWTGPLYLATRHFAGWWMYEHLGLAAEDVAIALGHEDGGELVRTLYGHRDRGRALARVRDAASDDANVIPFRTQDRTRRTA